MADNTMPDTTVPQLPGVIAYLMLQDAPGAAAFYEKAFGAEVRDRRPTEDGRLMHCMLEINGGMLMLSSTFPEHGYAAKEPHGFMLTLVTADAQTWWDRAVAAGCEVTMPLAVQFWGDRYGQLRDPFGVTWAINGPASA